MIPEMTVFLLSILSCYSQEQPSNDLSYMTISQVMPFLDVSQVQILPSQLQDFIQSQQDVCDVTKIETTKDESTSKQFLFQGDCFLRVSDTQPQKNKSIRDEQTFAHPFRETPETSLYFPYAKENKKPLFFEDIEPNLRLNGKIQIDDSNVDAEGFSIFQQNEDNTETLILYIDGFIDIKHQDNDIFDIDISGFFCGIFSDCTRKKPTEIDLRHQIARKKEEISQISLGTITQNRNISIEGSFLFDESLCDVRPFSGHIGIEKGIRYDITFEANCDSCALISQQGKPAIQICNDI